MIYQLKLLALFLILSGSIRGTASASICGTASNDCVEQYASRVIDFSSEWSPTNYSANQILGEENFYPNCDDSPLTWCASAAYGQQFIEVEFLEEVYIEKIEVYETSDPGGITKLAVWNGYSYVTVYSGEVQFNSTQATIFAPSFTTLTFKSNRVRLDYDARTTHAYWVEIDAIKITGKNETTTTCPEKEVICMKLKEHCELHATYCN